MFVFLVVVLLFWFFLKETKGEKWIGFVSCVYLQEAFGRFPGEAVILWKSYLLPLSILLAGQSIKGSVFFQALLEHLMNCYGSLWTRVIYSQSDSAISTGSPQRLWKVKHYHQGDTEKYCVTVYHRTRRLNKHCRTKHNSGTSHLLREGLSNFITTKYACREKYFLHFVTHLE